MSKYILVTPAKNEEENLPRLIKSIETQSSKPVLWVIVDDGSTDSTPAIIEKAKKQEWIKSIRLSEGKRDLGKHYAEVCRRGFEYAVRYCEDNEIEYEFIALVDADTILEKDYFKRLLAEFEDNPRLGIASGGVYFNEEGKGVWEKSRLDIPRGSGRIWRRECFEETNGYAITYSPDAVSNTKAKLRGWETRQFREIKATQARKTSSASGLWRGYKERGEWCYYLNYHPVFAIGKGVKELLKKPHYTGIAFLLGYLRSFLKREEKIEDKEIRDYYWQALKRYRR